MMIRILALMLAVYPLAMPVEAGLIEAVSSLFQKPAQTAPPKIKVLVVHDKVGAVLELKGKYKLFDPHTGEHISTRFIGKRKFIQTTSDGIKWGEEFPGIHQIMVIPDETATTAMVDGIEYHGPIYIYDIGGTISIVNQVSIEEYLSSTLAHDFRSPLSSEALAAVVIAARTAAYYQIENSPSEFWNVSGEDTNYEGFVAINPSSTIEKAIQATQYMIMSRSASSKDVTPFPLQWKGTKGNGTPGVVSEITIEEANEMAKKGDHAAQILAKAFPNTRIELMHYEPKIEPKKS